MKCDKCGKNEANFFYSSNINGNVTEKHLCSECAAEMEEGRHFFEGMDSMLEDMFSSIWGGRNLFARSFGSPFAGMRLAMPTFAFPHIEFRLDDGSASGTARTEETAGKTEHEESAADPELAKRREINMLREQMKTAADNEDFEKAAELRDKLRELEK